MTSCAGDVVLGRAGRSCAVQLDSYHARARSSHYIGRSALVTRANRTSPEQPFVTLRTVAFDKQELHRLLPPQSCVKAGKPALLLEPRPHRRRRPARRARRSARSRRPSPRRSPRGRRAARSRRARARCAPASAAASRCRSRNSSQLMLARVGSICCSTSRRTNSSTRRSISRSTSDAGTSKVTRAASCRSRSARISRSASCCASCSRSRAHLRPQRVERIERPEILRELVVERRHDALADRLDRRRRR